MANHIPSTIYVDLIFILANQSTRTRDHSKVGIFREILYVMIELVK